ncbi:MAG: hypothetical protein Fur0025_42050 [Oscillatoriaceae cyanobacterium]
MTYIEVTIYPNCPGSCYQNQQKITLDQVKYMTYLYESQPDRQGRIFPERHISAATPTKQKDEMARFDADCMAIFEKVRPALMQDYYNWFMAIEPTSGDYFIDIDEIEAERKAFEKHPDAPCLIVCINETGVCGRA